MSEFTSCKDCKHYDREDDCYCGACKHQIRKDFFEPKKKKVELEVGDYWFDENGNVHKDLGHSHNKFGIGRQTKEATELAAKRMLRVNRLSALASQLGGETYFEESTYCIRRQHSIWGYYSESYYFHPEKVYMNKETAEEICLLLNDGLFSLDNEE